MVDVHFANSQVKHFFQPSFFLESYREAFSEYQSLFYESFALSIDVVFFCFDASELKNASNIKEREL